MLSDPIQRMAYDRSTLPRESAARESQGDKIIQTTAPVSPGSSGGGLFDIAGRMVGVVTFQIRVGHNLNFAVPADWVSEMRTR